MTEPSDAGQDGVGERTLLIVDDDQPFLQRLAKAMERRGFEVTTADSAATGIDISPDGFDGIITKPIDPRRLRNTLIDAIRRRSGPQPPDSGSDPGSSANGEG